MRTIVITAAAAVKTMSTMMLPIVLGAEAATVASINHGAAAGSADSRESVSFSGKRNVSKTHNINSIRLFWVRKAQRWHCANASAVTSRAPKQMAAFSGENRVGLRGRAGKAR